MIIKFIVHLAIFAILIYGATDIAKSAQYNLLERWSLKGVLVFLSVLLIIVAAYVNGIFPLLEN